MQITVVLTGSVLPFDDTAFLSVIARVTRVSTRHVLCAYAVVSSPEALFTQACRWVYVSSNLELPSVLRGSRRLQSTVASNITATVVVTTTSEQVWQLLVYSRAVSGPFSDHL